MGIKLSILPGDLYQIRLPDGRWAYAQFLQRNDQLGYLIRVLNHITFQPVNDVSDLEEASDLFPPVFVGLLATLRNRRWEKIGNRPVLRFKFPLFRNTSGTKPGIYYDWRIWDGETSRRIGKLPPELQKLELEQVWGDEGLEERIVAGTYRGDRMF